MRCREIERERHKVRGIQRYFDRQGNIYKKLRKRVKDRKCERKREIGRQIE
jgi:hypothetical protein